MQGPVLRPQVAESTQGPVLRQQQASAAIVAAPPSRERAPGWET